MPSGKLRISSVIEFLETVKEQHGDIRMRDVTGFWIHQNPSTGERVVECSTGDGRGVDRTA